MQTIKNIQQIQKIILQLKKQNRTIGFVPTMGALHEGHASLLRKSKKENDVTVLSIFVNPIQFGPNEDFKKYPRPEKKDKSLAQKEKVDIIFYPTAEEMYGQNFSTHVEPNRLTETLCGQKRPGHFKGVATVVAKLLNITQPDRLYLGQKDFQQATILKKMVADLNFPVRIKLCPTIREKDGLAISSRNQYLSVQQRQQVPVLFQALKEAKRLVKNEKRGTDDIKKFVRSQITKKTSGVIDYIECVDMETLMPVKNFNRKTVIAIAVWFGQARLIDNIIL